MARESYTNAENKHHVGQTVHTGSTYQGNQDQDAVELSIYWNTDKYFGLDISRI